MIGGWWRESYGIKGKDLASNFNYRDYWPVLSILLAVFMGSPKTDSLQHAQKNGSVTCRRAAQWAWGGTMLVFTALLCVQETCSDSIEHINLHLLWQLWSDQAWHNIACVHAHTNTHSLTRLVWHRDLEWTKSNAASVGVLLQAPSTSSHPCAKPQTMPMSLKPPPSNLRTVHLLYHIRHWAWPNIWQVKEPWVHVLILHQLWQG
jgi:hypothetical protein